MSDRLTVLSGEFATRYRIERQIGSGATAVVYLARDSQRDERVALKVLRPELAASIGGDRFLREIQLHQRLLHPRILPVIDSGESAGQLFFALPFAEGGTLRDRLARDKQLPLRDAIRIAQAVAQALEYSHSKGVVHRDVKPENILFTSGETCLGDFGIARALEQALEQSTTSTGLVRGTPAYMSPEQAAGQTDLDARSDIFSLGCVLFEAIAGIAPFHGATAQSVIALRMSRTPDPVSLYRDTVPTALDRVVAKCLKLTPADRFQTAAELVAALEGVLADVDNPNAPRTHARRNALTKRWVGRGAIAVAAAAVVFLSWLAFKPAIATGDIPEGDPRRIAVLYLDDLTPETVPQHVVDGLTEDLIDRLGGVSVLHVISPNGVRQFRSANLPIDSIGRLLKVGTIVGGSVARSGNTLRVSVRLMDATTGRQLQSETVEEPWAELFTLQEKLTEKVAFVLRQRVGDALALREHRRATNSLQAWEYAQRASAEVRLALLSQRNDPQWWLLFERADSLYVLAQRADPQWVLPIVRRGRIALALALGASRPPVSGDSLAFQRLPLVERMQVWVKRTLVLADSALAHSPKTVDALTLRGDAIYRLSNVSPGVSDSLIPLAERDLRTAVDLRPDDVGGWQSLAQIWVAQGRYAEAANAARRAFQADAFFEVRSTISTAITATLYAEQFDDAARWCRLGLSHYADDSRFVQCALVVLGWSGRRRPDVDSAWKIVANVEKRDSVGRLAPTWMYRRILVAAILARAGLRDSARALVDLVRARELTDPSNRSAAIGKAYVRVLVGDRDGALEDLTTYVRATPGAKSMLRTHPWFRPLSTDRRFSALVQPTP